MARLDDNIIGRIKLYAADEDSDPAIIIDPVSGNILFGSGSTAPTRALDLDADGLQLIDNDILKFGTGDDANLSWNATHMEFGPSGSVMWNNAPSPGMSDYDTQFTSFFDDFHDSTIPVATRWTVTEDQSQATQVITTDVREGIMKLAAVNTVDDEGSQINFIQETFRFVSGKQLWMEMRIKCAAGDATNLDFFVGLAAAEDITGVADNMPANGFGFHCDDGDVNIDLSTSDNGSNVQVATVGTLVDAAWIKLGLHFDGGATGSGVITPYVDGVAKTTLTTAAYGTMVEVAPMFMIRNGDGTTAQTLEIDYIKVVEAR